MKTLKKLLFITIMTTVMVILFCPHKVQAARDFKVTKLKQKTWAKLQPPDSKLYYAYKISAPSNGYVKIETNTASEEIYLIKDLKQNYTYDYHLLRYAKTYCLVLPKGTYYLACETEPSYINTPIKVRWTAVKHTDPANFKRSKAKKISRGKTTKVVFNDGYEYDKWYKIILTSNESVKFNFRITGNTSNYQHEYINASGISIYDSRGRLISNSDFKQGKSTIIQDLLKGTYYIKIDSPHFGAWNYFADPERVYDLSWNYYDDPF